MQVAAAAAVFVTTGNIGLSVLAFQAVGTLNNAVGLGAKAARPPTTEQQIKTERPPRIHALGVSRLYGASIAFETINGTTVDVWAFHDGRAASILRTYLNDKLVTTSGNVVNALPDKSYQGGNVKLGYSLGLPTGTAFAAVTAVMPAWDATHRGDGVVTGYLLKNPEKEKYFLETYPQGDNVALSLVGQWTPKHDPRVPTSNAYDPSTWPWSDNAVLAFIWYMMVERGYDWNTAFQPQITKLLTAINIADQDIPLAAGGTEKRYRTALSYNATEAPANVVNSLLACFDGWYVVNERGEIVVYAGAYYEPTVTIGPDEIVAWQQPMNVAKENVVNEIAIPYVSALHDYATVDGQAWRDEDSISTLGRVNTSELGAVIPSFTQGRRLAKIKMARNNAQDRGTNTTTFAGRAAFGERFIRLKNIEAGATFFDGVAEIIAAQRDTATGGTTFEWIAADPNAYAWNPATESGEGAPVGNRYAPAPLALPTIDTATVTFSDSTDSGTGARVLIVATGPATSGITWYARWRKDSTSPWNEQEYSDLDPGASVQLLTSFVPVVATLQVEVEYRNPDGRLSGYTAPLTVDTRTSTTPPDAATAITLVSWSDTLRLATDRIARASTYRWRFYASDGTTLIRTISTSTPEVGYSSQQAATDGARRSYIVRVAGVNGAGAGTEALTGTIALAAPGAVTGVSATGGSTEAQVAFTLLTTAGVAGYIIPISTTSGFDPLTQGTIFRNGGSSPAYIQGLAAGTFYTKVAAYDAWTDRPDLLNFSPEASFTITTGGGGVGGGGGGGGGGYCVTIDTLVLMADGTEKPAGELAVGDMVWTQPDDPDGPGAWGAYPVEYIEIVSEDVLAANIGSALMRATAGHLIWIGGAWTRFDAIGMPCGTADVAKITVTDAHTYVANGVLSHNIKQQEPFS